MARRHITTIIVGCSMVWPLAVSAQRLGTFDVGVYGQFTMLDETLPIDNGPGLGGRLGIFLHRIVSVEGSIGYSFLQTPAGGSVGHVPWRGLLMLHAPAGSNVAILLGGGLVHNQYVKALDGSDNGVSGALGLRLGLTESVFLRAEGIGDFMTFPTNEAQGVANNLNLGLQIGMAVHFSAAGDGRRVIAERPGDQANVAPEDPPVAPPAPMDTDGDGVVDRDDRCPNTGGGQAVDASGCLLDDDADGIPNVRDRCADTAAGAAVDDTGCSVRIETDGDGDGVVDGQDACPGTPTGSAVDARGCPEPADSDGDGVDDTRDQCAGTPDGAAVDSAGCPIPTDSDGDRVNDPEDRCPSTPSGTRVDATGCPVSDAVEPPAPVVLEGVTFISNSSGITGRVAPILNRVADSLIANPGARIEVSGHTDDRGERTDNIELSLQRARAVVDYLVSRGVPRDRLVARGYGPDQPIADNGTREGRLRNRRVELRVVSP